MPIKENIKDLNIFSKKRTELQVFIERILSLSCVMVPPSARKKKLAGT